MCSIGVALWQQFYTQEYVCIFVQPQAFLPPPPPCTVVWRAGSNQPGKKMQFFLPFLSHGGRRGKENQRRGAGKIVSVYFLF
jgi:hypothetical protein